MAQTSAQLLLLKHGFYARNARNTLVYYNYNDYHNSNCSNYYNNDYYHCYNYGN